LATANNILCIVDQTVEIDFASEPLPTRCMGTSIVQTAPLPGPKTASTIAFKTRVLTEAATPATANFALAKLLGYYMGGLDTSTDGGIAGAAGPIDGSTFDVLTGAAASVKEGQMVVGKDATDGTKEVRWITDVTVGAPNDTFSLNQDFSFTPGVGDTIYFGHTLYFTDVLASGESQYFRFIQEETNQAWDLYGCRAVSVTIAVEDGQPTLTWNYAITEWVQLDAQTPSALVWPFGSAFAYMQHAFYIDAAKVDIKPDWTIDPGQTLDSMPTPEGQGRQDWEVADRASLMSWSPKWSKAHHGRFEATTIVGIMLNGQEGVSAGNEHWGVLMPAAHYTAVPGQGTEGNQIFSEVECRAGHDDTIDTGSTVPADTDFRIGFITSA